MILATPPAPTLDDLAVLPLVELERLFRDAAPPASIAALDGALTGRLLAVRRLDRGAVARALRRWAKSPRFVWSGKTFTSTSALAGAGINRIHLPGVLGRQTLFPFATSIAPSLLDGRDAVVLDYDRPENPRYIRQIRDELRQVGPGAFLGPALWLGPPRRPGATLLLWFALTTQRE